MTGGAELSLIGVSIVFTALVTLIAVVSLMTRLLAPRPAAAEGALDSARATPAEETAPVADGASLTNVALAAYATHRRRSQRVRSAPIPTQWEVAGRIRALTRSH